VTASLTVTESKSTEIDISEEQADKLNELGHRLASQSEWWGADNETAEEEKSAPTVIRCDPTTDGRWRINVRSVVGLISTGTIQIHVQPKIPQQHLLYLWGKSGRFPVLDETAGRIAVGEDLWQLMSNWYVTAAEGVLRRDLIRDYAETFDVLKMKRGKLRALGTARSYYSGRMELHCDYEEFDIDTPLNRTLLHALKIILQAPNPDLLLRRRAAAIKARMEGVGEFQYGDLRIIPDRRTHHYSDAITLAKHIIRSVGRNLGEGSGSAWTFLIRTPEMVEEGLRNILTEQLANQCSVEKRGFQISGSSMTLNPDLLFGGGLAVGDIKYKLLKPDWSRPDLYQLATFATGYSSRYGVIVGFQRHLSPLPPRVEIGPLSLSCLAWNAFEDLTPSEATHKLSRELANWLSDIEQHPSFPAIDQPTEVAV
jgi:5-methylcytosine-specific restriction enzyme subunit McrC